ncbi:hypothetical protein HYW44_00940 [Candidatus Daviesbacteria bacterium]|nr:hypothetical protein [Candidatus Daviesbacteria bacterium]
MKCTAKREEKREKRKFFLKILFIFFMLTLHSSLLTPYSFAQTSPSGSLIQKLDELKKEIASKAAEIKNEVNKKVQNKAVVGKIMKIDEGKIIIQSINPVRTINFDEFTEVIGLNNKKIKITTLEVGDNVASLGDFDDKNNLAVKRIVFLENFATSSGELVWGQIQKSQGQSINIKSKSGDNETIITNSQTVFALGNNEASIADAKPEKFMVARGIRLKDNSLRARFVYFIPAVGFVKPSVKESSSSAQSQ